MGEIAAAVSAVAAVTGVLLVIFGVGSTSPTKPRSEPTAEAAPPAAPPPSTGTPTPSPSTPSPLPTPSAPSTPATSGPPTSPAVTPGTVLRTETFDLASGYGFDIEDAPLRPGPGDIDETGSKYDLWNSSHQSLLLARRDTRLVLLKDRENATYQTCRRQSAFETTLHDQDWDNASLCAYSPTGLIAGIETGTVDGTGPVPM
ncbi:MULTISPECIES: hypothetical protein [Streptomyces]|uniref:hypothetical protein n=1 Tax=Streptomyces TaxID=1883 RepID=UPI0012FF1DBB|nr:MULTISPECIES: hypothetical protein [Streptomyces]